MSNSGKPYKRRMARLFYPSRYQKFRWFDDVLEARRRRNFLEREFDRVGDKDKLLINKELEIIDDYFDWLEIV